MFRMRKGSTWRWVSGATWVPLVAAAILVVLWIGLAVTGYRSLIVMSGSMAPTLQPGDVVVVKMIPAGQAKPGEIVSFRDATRAGELVTHRIIGKARVGPTVAFVTRGDRNTGVEQWSTATDGTIGRLSLRIPAVGRLLVWLGRSNVRAAFFAGSLILLAMVALQLVWQLGRPLPRPGYLALVALIGLAVGARTLPETFSAFSSQTSNPGNTFAAAPTFCSAPGTQTVSATANATVKQANPDTNTSTGSGLFVKTSPSGDNKRALVMFNLPAPNGCSVTSAALKVFEGTVQGSRTIQAWQLSGPWTETGVTWNNQPAAAGAPATVANAQNTWQSWDVAAIVRQMYASGGFGFVLRDATESDTNAFEQIFDNRSTPNVPQLQVTFG